MDLPLALFLWVVGFLVTLGLIYEYVMARGMHGKWYSWILLLLVLFVVWPIILGSSIMYAIRRL